MEEFKDYLQHELNKLEGNEPLKIQVCDNNGVFTKWITLPNIPTADLMEILTRGQK